MQSLAAENALTITGTNGGQNAGIDMGSRNFAAVKTPKVALLVGDGVPSYDAGEIWHLMDTRFNIPVTKIDTRNISRIDMTAYTHFIIPSFSGSALNSQVEKLKAYVRQGGVIIGYRNTLNWLDRNEFIDLDFKSTSRDAKTSPLTNAENLEEPKKLVVPSLIQKLTAVTPLILIHSNEVARV